MFSKKNYIGVSVNDEAIEIVELKPMKGGLFTISDFSYFPLESKIIENGNILNIDSLSVSLKKAFKENGAKFSSNLVCLTLPDPVTFFHTFSFPGAVPDREIPNAISFKYDEVFPVPASDSKGDYAVVARDHEQTTVQYSLTSMKIIRDYINVFEKAGLKLFGIGLEAQAIERAILGDPEEKKASIIANITEESASIFIRDAYGIHATFFEMFDKTGKAEALFKEIVSIMSWFHRISPANVLEEIVFVGNPNIVSSIKPKFGKLLSEFDEKINLRVGTSFNKIVNSEKVKNVSKYKDVASYDVAIGSALGELLPCDKKYEFLPSAKCGPVVLKNKYVVVDGDSSGKNVGLYIETISEKKKTIFAVIFAFIMLAILGTVLILHFISMNKVDSSINDLMQNHKSSLQVR